MSTELPRLLAGVHEDGSPIDLEEHLQLHGVLPLPRRRQGAALIGLVDASGLQGRGGAGFPTGRKLRAVASGRRSPVVVGNGAEGEPVSGKDRVLIRQAPHLVLDGVSLAAAAVDAREAIVAVSSRTDAAVLRQALAERRLDRVPIRIETLPPAFVAGEETALVNWLNGGPAKPTFTPPRPFERGVDGRPTLVQNVETLAHLALIARRGADWFRRLGTKAEPGSVLVTLGGAVRQPGVYELPLGLRLGELLDWAGGPAAQLSAVLVGGYFGSWLPIDRALAARLLEADLRAHGSSLGARALHALPRSTCGIVESARVMRYLAGQSARQCGPCVHGLAAVATALEHLAVGNAVRGQEPDRIKHWLRQIDGRGACRHPDGAVAFVKSALSVFADELERHADGRCSAPASLSVLPLLPA